MRELDRERRLNLGAQFGVVMFDFLDFGWGLD